jgi:hypothetical protein
MAAKKAPDHPLDPEANQRIEDCRRQKMAFDLDMRECYFFTAPLRSRQVTSTSSIATAPVHDEGFLQTSAGYEIIGDHVTEVMNSFLPQNEQWCERKKGIFIKLPDWETIKAQVLADDIEIFSAIKGCNFYAEFAKAAYPDLGIGTMALWIDDPRPGENIIVQAVPLRELEINLGPFGEIDDRFIVRHTRNRHVKALLPGIEIPADIQKEIDEGPNKHTELRWGYWRLWDRLGDEHWRHVVMIKNRVVKTVDMVGEGCCPLVVSRFNATADWAYGLGVMLQGLPEFRQVDELEGQKVSHIELNLTPPMGYPDDSFAAVEQGLEPGMAYPVRPGSEGAIKPLYQPGSPEAGIYAVEDKIRHLRKLCYVDYPEQRGDTPPTLGQWMDELARAQRRIGTPGLTFWWEGPAKYFLRFKYLLESKGVIHPVKVNGKAVALTPSNPAQRAAEQQEVAMAVRAIQILGQAFPEEFRIYVDGKMTIKAFLEKMRVTLLKERPEGEVKAGDRPDGAAARPPRRTDRRSRSGAGAAMTQNDQPLNPGRRRSRGDQAHRGARATALCFTAICAAFWRVCST